MPSTSRMVAQVKPVCPRSAMRRASAVVLNALTCGRSRRLADADDRLLGIVMVATIANVLLLGALAVFVLRIS